MLEGTVSTHGQQGRRQQRHVFRRSFQEYRQCYEEVLLTPLAYVDLNLVAAGMAKTPDDSEHTSIKARNKMQCPHELRS